MQQSVRSRRVAEVIKKEVLNIITSSVHDPKVKDVIITSTQVSTDLEIAKIYFTTYDQSRLEGIKLGLDRASSFIRKELFRSIHLKKLPKLEFIIDSTQDEARRIDELLKKIETHE